MATKIIVIVGITGNQGASVADVFLEDPHYKIRGISRDPNKASSKEWSDKGVEMVAGDLNNVDSLKSAFKGSHIIFGVTDFWQGMNDPANHEKAEKEGRPINEICYDIEVQQGKNIVDAAAATVDTLDRFVLSTLSNARKWSGGKVTWNYHFDAKWVAVDYLRATYPELDKKTSLVQVGLFATNWKSMPTVAPQKQSDGTYVLRLPVKPDSSLPMVDPRRDTGNFVKALVEVEPAKNLLGAANMLSWKEYCELWGKILGVSCRYEEMTVSEWQKIMPGPIGKEIGDMWVYLSEFGYDGHDPGVVLPKDLEVEVPVTTIEEYIKQEDWSSIL